MKKKIISALMAALVVGVASPTFAAEIDDEVVELRARLAQLERRIAERDAAREYERYSRPTNNFSDRFSFEGEARYRYYYVKSKGVVSRSSPLQLRVAPTFTINDNSDVKSRFSVEYNTITSPNGDSASDVHADYVYYSADFDKFHLNAGKMPLITQADSNPNSGSMIIDNYFSGAQLITSNETDNVNFFLNLGRYSGTDEDGTVADDPNSAAYYGAEAVFNSDDGKLSLGAGYHFLKDGNLKDNILALGGGYQLNEDIGLYGAYAHNSKAAKKNSYNLEGVYRGADPAVAKSWGAYVAYRYLPSNIIANNASYDAFISGLKGFDIGARWTPIEDTLFKVSYSHGKTIFGDVTAKAFFTQASLFF